MVIIKGNFWEVYESYDAVCICNSYSLDERGNSIMGKGVQLGARLKFPESPKVFGSIIQDREVIVAGYKTSSGIYLINFPVKMNWWEPIDPDLVKKSTKELKNLADSMDWSSVLIPTPKCIQNKLAWSIIGPYMSNNLDNRFYVIEE